MLGCIKQVMHGVPEKAKLLAYTSICQPVLEYTEVLWDPANKGISDFIEMVQNKAVRFIKNKH